MEEMVTFFVLYGVAMAVAGGYLYHKFGAQSSVKIGQLEVRAKNAEHLAEALEKAVLAKAAAIKQLL